MASLPKPIGFGLTASDGCVPLLLLFSLSLRNTPTTRAMAQRLVLDNYIDVVVNASRHGAPGRSIQRVARRDRATAEWGFPPLPHCCCCCRRWRCRKISITSDRTLSVIPLFRIMFEIRETRTLFLLLLGLRLLFFFFFCFAAALFLFVVFVSFVTPDDTFFDVIFIIIVVVVAMAAMVATIRVAIA